MNKWNKMLALLLALCLTVGLVPVTAFATETEGVEAQAEELTVKDYPTFMENLKILEGYAKEFSAANSKYDDPSLLVINYVRTGVERYLDGNWKTLAGEEITDFTNYVTQQDAAKGTEVGCLRNIIVKDFVLPNGQQTDFGHMFGALNIAYIAAVATGDLGGWAGDICDLLLYSKEYGNVPEGTIDEMADYIRTKCFGVNADHAYGMDDWYGDMDAFYINETLKKNGGSISELFEAYFTAELTDEARAAFFLNTRFSGLLTKEDVRQAIYSTYKSNVGLQVLEADRGLSDSAALREAACYGFADYLFNLAGDKLTGEGSGDGDGETGDGETGDGEGSGDGETGDGENGDGEGNEPAGNPYYSVFSSSESLLAPGVTQYINYAFTADDKQLAYYVAVVDINRDDLSIHANYKDNDPSKGWGMARVEDQIAAAVKNHSHIENYTPVVGVNGDFYNMSTGKVSGALVMEGVTYMPANGNNFFAVLNDGTPVIGTGDEWAKYENQVQEAIGGSAILVRDGVSLFTSTGNYYNSRASRTCIGITAEGEVVLMVVDGRQEPFSCGGSYEELAQIMLDAGCVIAMNLDGGGSTTFLAKQEGSDSISLVNNPSDGYARSVSSSLMVISTAVLSDEFDHAVITCENEYLTVGTSMKLDVLGVSNTGTAAELPADLVWKLSDNTIGTVKDGVFTATANGDVELQLTLANGKVVGKKTLHVVVPDKIFFTSETLNVIYGVPTALPINATYKGNLVSTNPDDFLFLLDNEEAGSFDGFNFIGTEENGIRVTHVLGILAANDNLYASMRISLYKEDEAVFDFDNATGGDKKFAWERVVTNAETSDGVLYQIVDTNEDMSLSYTFGLDMTAIEMPDKLVPLIGMLPGGDDPNATAWDFLLQLAERVSVLSEVKVVVDMDDNLDVDFSNIRVSTEYFYLADKVVDEETNTMTLICKWVDQEAAIPSETANPICILSGVTATIRDTAEWKNDKLKIHNTGAITYDIYLRANALYSFALQESNQQTYQLYPFDNPDVIIGGTTEKGAHFADTYAEFDESYTLDRTNRQGWYSNGNFLYYYVDNEPISGLQRVPAYDHPEEKYFYYFNEDGSCDGAVSGMIEYEGGLYFVVAGKAKTGWQTSMGADKTILYYYFNPATGAAVNGEQKIGGYNYTFKDYILTRGEIVTDANGSRYMWAGEFITQAWVHVDGDIYYAPQNGYFLVGPRWAYAEDGAWTYFAFDRTTGRWMQEYTGFYDYDKGQYNEAGTYYIENGIVKPTAGLQFKGGYYYYFHGETGIMVKNGRYWVEITNGLMKKANYNFDEQGRMINPPANAVIPVNHGLVTEGGKIYHYVYGELSYAGLMYISGYYYYADPTTGEVVANGSYKVEKPNGLLAEGTYQFNEKGQMVNVPSGAVIPDHYEVEGVTRVAGNDRYKTAFAAAEVLKRNMDVEKFNCIVVACGTEFADALSGSYLANKMNAPMLLVRKQNVETVKEYIKANLNPGGTVYILGGEAAVPKNMDTGLEGFTVKRLAGSTRYTTNLLILKEAGVGSDDILVCTGKDFADSLAASAANRPILLVKDSLNTDQKKFLSELSGNKIIILGGKNAVSEKLEKALASYGTVERIGGSTRYETSVLIAKKFFPNADSMVLAVANEFPDGLCGGCLAYSLDMPVVLVTSSKTSAAKAYATEKNITDALILGGNTRITDSAAREILSLGGDTAVKTFK